MTPAGIEPATFRFVAQHLNHCATAVTQYITTFAMYKQKCIQALHNVALTERYE